MIWEYGYDLADQLTRAVKRATDPPGTILQRFAYAYDPAGNRTAEQIDDQVLGASYDGLNRLVSQQPAGPMVFSGTVSEPAAVTVQGIPAVVGGDNTFRATVPLPSGTNTVTVRATDASGNTATKQYEVDSLGSGRSFTYDANGDLTGDGTRTFEWDARNQLVAVNVGTARVEFTYNAEKQRLRRVEKQSGLVESESWLIWCDDRVCEDRRSDGQTVNARNLRNGQQPVAQSAGVFATDHLGSVWDVTDQAGLEMARYDYHPFGVRTLLSGIDVVAVGYTGHRWDETAQLWLSLYRGYDPRIGRWLNEDPVRLADGPNLYRYVAGNPLRYHDPLGLKVTCVQTFREEFFGKCPPGAGACTSSSMKLESLSGCRRRGGCGLYGFDITIKVSHVIRYPSGRRGDRSADGLTLGEHELNHISDIDRWCNGLGPTEGFRDLTECMAAQKSLLDTLRQNFRQARDDSEKRRDKK